MDISGTSNIRSMVRRDVLSPLPRPVRKPCLVIPGLPFIQMMIATKPLIGKHVVLPLVGRRIPIVADEYADPEQGSGAVKITPAHDFNDFEVGKRQNLRQINIFDQNADLLLKDNPEFIEDIAQSEELSATLALHGMDRFNARKKIVERMEALGLVEKIDEHPHTVPYGDRSNVVIEPWLTEQWYVDAATLAKPAIAAVKDGDTVFVPKNWEKTYFEWMNNIQPWCISRQLWWGHQIPAWYGPRRSCVCRRDRKPRA